MIINLFKMKNPIEWRRCKRIDLVN